MVEQISNQLVAEIINQHFGPLVGAISHTLMKAGPTPLSLLVRESKIKLNYVKKSLTTLLHHNLVSISLHDKGFIQYEIIEKNVLCMIRYPRYIYIAKLL